MGRAESPPPADRAALPDSRGRNAFDDDVALRQLLPLLLLLKRQNSKSLWAKHPMTRKLA